MSPLKATIKWEAIKWWHYVGKWLWVIVLCWVIMLTPLAVIEPEGSILGANVLSALFLVVFLAGFISIIFIMGMMIVYPLFISFTTSLKSAVLERGSGYSAAYQICVRLLFIVATYVLGAGFSLVSMMITRWWEAADVVWLSVISINDIWGFIRLFIDLFPLMAIALPLIIRVGCSRINVKAMCQNKWSVIMQCLITIPFLMSIPGMMLPIFSSNMIYRWHVGVAWGVFILSSVLYTFFTIRVIDRCAEVNV